MLSNSGCVYPKVKRKSHLIRDFIHFMKKEKNLLLLSYFVNIHRFFHVFFLFSSHCDPHPTFSHLASGLWWTCVPGVWLQSCFHQHHLVPWWHQGAVGLQHQRTPQRPGRKVQHPKPPSSVPIQLVTWSDPHLQGDTYNHHPSPEYI